MASVVRLVTYVEVDDRAANDRQISVSARHEAELDDGRSLLLLDDRGWGLSGSPGIWARTSVAEVESTTRMVVGPDEPFGEYTRADMAADHWAGLASTLQRRGVTVDAARLARSRHDVVLGERLLARLAAAGRP